MQLERLIKIIYLFIHFCLFICLSVCLFVCLFSLFVCFLCLFVFSVCFLCSFVRSFVRSFVAPSCSFSAMQCSFLHIQPAVKVFLPSLSRCCQIAPSATASCGWSGRNITHIWRHAHLLTLRTILIRTPCGLVNPDRRLALRE